MKQVKLTSDEIWEMYCHVKNCENNYSKALPYAKKYGLLYGSFNAFRFKVYMAENRPNIVEVYKKFKESGQTKETFCHENKISVPILKNIVTHFSYKRVIDDYIARGVPMTIGEAKEVPDVAPAMAPNAEPYAVPKEAPKAAPLGFIKVPAPSVQSNTVSLSCSNGIQIQLPPGLPTEKLIKLIQLLQGL